MITDITRIRRKVLTEVASLAFKGTLKEEIDAIPARLLAESHTKFGCCEYKEKAILTDRIKLALGADLSQSSDDERLSDVAHRMNYDKDSWAPLVSIIKKACDNCPIDAVVVTNACRNCSAHHCINRCPRNAIEIVAGRAFINREKCVECGLCAKVCPYSAIITIERPCMKVCGTGAIAPCDSSTACIDYSKCVECGACMKACPFGAISDASSIVRVIQMLKAKEASVVAMVAPAFAGQFGPMVSWNDLEMGLRRIGFSAALPVALGADVVAGKESEELLEKLEHEEGPLLNSCCPAFKQLVREQFTDLASHVSTTSSPMIESARIAKQMGLGENVKCVFIGPCIAKKGEARREGLGLVDAVLTFEELAAMFVAASVNLASIEPFEAIVDDKPSIDAMKFCQAGGVASALTNAVAGVSNEEQHNIKTMSVAGISKCVAMLKGIQNGKVATDFLEGMGCEGGCVGGPGTIVDAKIASAALTKLIKTRENQNN